MNERSIPIDPKAFRQALGTFTTGVTIVTARDAQGRALGLTANSFNSVSLDPPMVLWSLSKSSRNLPAYQAADHWAVHILSVEQEDLSNRFARSGDDKFDGVAVEPGVAGLPLLRGCTTRLQCRTRFRYEGGDHIIFVGEVLAFDRSDAPPLVFQAGAYAVATRKPAPSEAAAPGIDFGDDYLGYLLLRTQVDLARRVSAVHRRHALDDEGFFLLPYLLARGAQSLATVNAVFAQVGRSVSQQQVAELIGRGLLRVDERADDLAALHITDAGRDISLQVLAEVKAIESQALAALGGWEAHALKNALKRLVQAAPSVPAHRMKECV